MQTSLTGPIMLVAFVLAAPATLAQSLSLQDGDAVSVSGAGTFGTIGGQTVASPGATSYFGNPAVQTNGTATFTLGPGGALYPALYSDALDITGSGAVAITGGIADGDVGIGGSSPVTFSGGAIGNIYSSVALFTNGSGLVSIQGGSFLGYNALSATGSGNVTITGGSFNPQGGTGISCAYGGVLNLFSFGDTPFLINGMAMNNTSLDKTAYQDPYNHIQGTLLDGETLDTTFGAYQGTINLNIGSPPVAAPEPTQLAALGIGLLGLGALTLRAKRRQAA